jgi:hypothetical protein
MIEEDQSLQGTMVCGSRHLSLHGQMEEQSANVWGTHVRGVALTMEENKAPGPWLIRLCRADTQVCEASDLPHLIEPCCF